MANQKHTYAMTHERRGLDLVEEWLHIEGLAQPTRRQGLYPNNAYSKAQQIYRRQIPNNMERFRRAIDPLIDGSADEATTLALGRLVLDSASLAQHGFVLGKIARGDDIMTAMDESWHVLQGFKQHVRAKKVRLPDAAQLKEPVQNAVAEYTHHPYGHFIHTYVGMVAFSASVAVHLRDAESGAFVLPVPGMSSDTLDRWSYDPPLVPRSQHIEL